jgi:hypothetical protein
VKGKNPGSPIPRCFPTRENLPTSPFDIGSQYPSAWTVPVRQAPWECCKTAGCVAQFPLTKVAKFQSGVLGGKVRQFSYKGRNHSRASLVINTWTDPLVCFSKDGTRRATTCVQCGLELLQPECCGWSPDQRFWFR